MLVVSCRSALGDVTPIGLIEIYVTRGRLESGWWQNDGKYRSEGHRSGVSKNAGRSEWTWL